MQFYRDRTAGHQPDAVYLEVRNAEAVIGVGFDDQYVRVLAKLNENGRFQPALCAARAVNPDRNVKRLVCSETRNRSYGQQCYRPVDPLALSP